MKGEYMKKTVPFKKELTFNNNLAEITSIALDHNLELQGKTVQGELEISGSYKMNDISINTEEFKFNLPVSIELSDRYDVSYLEIDIEDFYYEIIDSNVLSVNVEIALNNLNEVSLEPVTLERTELVSEQDQEEVEEEAIPIPVEVETPATKLETRLDASEVKTLFDSFDESLETYATYKVCIVKEADTLESICIRYGITREVLDQYNDTNDIKIGDKLIIPSLMDEKN